MVLIDPTFDDVTVIRVVNLCQCVTHVRALGHWDTGATTETSADADSGSLELTFELAAEVGANEVNVVATITFDDGIEVEYPLDTPLRSVRTRGLIDITISADSRVEPSSVTDLLVIPIPADVGDLDVHTTPDSWGWYLPLIDGENYGPSVVTVAGTNIYVGDPVGGRIAVVAFHGEVTYIPLNTEPSRLIDIQGMAVDINHRRLYIDVNDSIIAVDTDSHRVVWDIHVPGMWPRSLVTHRGMTTIRVGHDCFVVDPTDGPLLDSSSPKGLCVIDDVRDGHARVVIEVDGSQYASLRVVSSELEPTRVEVHRVDMETGTVYGAMHLRDASGARVNLAFAASTDRTVVVDLPVSTDDRFRNYLPDVAEGTATGLVFSDGKLHLTKVTFS